MFELVEVAEQVCEGGVPSKFPTRVEANSDSHVRQKNGGGAASPTNPDKVHSGKCKTKNAGHTSDAPTRLKKYLLYGHVHSSE